MLRGKSEQKNDAKKHSTVYSQRSKEKCWIRLRESNLHEAKKKLQTIH